jgi:hypothetical protein
VELVIAVDDFLVSPVGHLPSFWAGLVDFDGTRLWVPKTINFGAVEREVHFVDQFGPHRAGFSSYRRRG